MQPSKVYDYKVNDTTDLVCEVTSILIDIEAAKNIECGNDNCQVKANLHTIPSKLNRGNFVYAVLEDDYYSALSETLKTKSLKDILELGLLS